MGWTITPLLVLASYGRYTTFDHICMRFLAVVCSYFLYSAETHVVGIQFSPLLVLDASQWPRVWPIMSLEPSWSLGLAIS